MTDEWTEADDVIEEVREIRRQMWAEFDYDLEKMAAYFMELDKKYAARMIDAPVTSRKDLPAAWQHVGPRVEPPRRGKKNDPAA